jgi:hypothetical protein
MTALPDRAEAVVAVAWGAPVGGAGSLACSLFLRQGA